MIEQLKNHWPAYLRGIFIGAALIVALNTADKVITVNVWPSVLTAHGVM